MKAQYVRLLSDRYNKIRHTYISDSPEHHVYKFIYPQIYNAVRLGLTSVTLEAKIPETVVSILLKDGFKVTMNEHTFKETIDWTFPAIYSSNGQRLL